MLCQNKMNVKMLRVSSLMSCVGSILRLLPRTCTKHCRPDVSCPFLTHGNGNFFVVVVVVLFCFCFELFSF